MDAKEVLAKLGGSKRKAKGLPKRYKKRGPKIKAYYASVYPARKIRRLLRHNGYAAAKAWADERGYLSLLSKLTN